MSCASHQLMSCNFHLDISEIPRLCKEGLGEVDSLVLSLLAPHAEESDVVRCQLKTISRVQWVFCDAGFRPGCRTTFVSAKGPKTMLAILWPPASAGASSSGSLCGSPTPAARKLAPLKQCAPFLRCRLHCSATTPGQGRLFGQIRQKGGFG